MSSGKTHAIGSLVSAPIAMGLVYSYTSDPRLALFAGIGSVSGILLTPDLDQESISASEWKLIQITCGIGFLWNALWGPYSTFIPHRSVLSHLPVLGTCLRLLYLYAALSICLWIFDSTLSLPSFEVLVRSPDFRAFVAGLVASDISHWILDLPIVSRRRSRASSSRSR